MNDYDLLFSSTSTVVFHSGNFISFLKIETAVMPVIPVATVVNTTADTSQPEPSPVTPTASVPVTVTPPLPSLIFCCQLLVCLLLRYQYILLIFIRLNLHAYVIFRFYKESSLYQLCIGYKEITSIVTI